MYECTSVVIRDFSDFSWKKNEEKNPQDLYKSLHYVHYS